MKYSDLTDEQKKVLSLFRKLTEDKQKEALEHFRKLADSDRHTKENETEG